MASRPNFFIAARIINEFTVANLKKVSDHIKTKDEFLGKCCTVPEKLHLTLFVLKLDSPDDILNVSEALQSLVKKELPPVTLNLEGLGHFNRRVLYSSFSENASFTELRQNLLDELDARNLLGNASTGFTPHITIAKLSRPRGSCRQPRSIKKEIYVDFAENVFGMQKINKLLLCHINGECREDGFYKCASEAVLNEE